MQPSLGDEALDFLLDRSGLHPTPEQKQQLEAAFAKVSEMAARVRKPRGRMAEPALTYGFAEEDLA